MTFRELLNLAMFCRLAQKKHDREKTHLALVIARDAERRLDRAIAEASKPPEPELYDEEDILIIEDFPPPSKEAPPGGEKK